jgi:hypothetical protein
MVVVFAGLGRSPEAALEIAHGEFLNAAPHPPRVHPDAMLREELECTPSNPTDDNRLNALFSEPERQPARLMRWRGHELHVEDHSAFRFRVNDGKLGATAKVPVQLTVCHRDGDSNSGFLGMVFCWHIVAVFHAGSVPYSRPRAIWAQSA